MYSSFLSSSFFIFCTSLLELFCFVLVFFCFLFFFLCLLVVTTAQLHSTKPELRFYTFNHFTKTIYRHHHHCSVVFEGMWNSVRMFEWVSECERETESERQRQRYRDRDREWGVRGWGIVNKNALYYPLVSLYPLQVKCGKIYILLKPTIYKI